MKCLHSQGHTVNELDEHNPIQGQLSQSYRQALRQGKMLGPGVISILMTHQFLESATLVPQHSGVVFVLKTTNLILMYSLQ